MGLMNEMESIRGKHRLFHPMSKDEFFHRDQISQKSIDDDNLISHKEVRSWFLKSKKNKR